MKKRRKALEVYVLVVAVAVLSIVVMVSCGRSQPASSPGVSEAGNTSHEAELPVIGEASDFELTNHDGEVHHHERGFSHMNQAFLIDQDGMLRRQYLGIQIGGWPGSSSSSYAGRYQGVVRLFVRRSFSSLHYVGGELLKLLQS